MPDNFEGVLTSMEEDLKNSLNSIPVEEYLTKVESVTIPSPPPNTWAPTPSVKEYNIVGKDYNLPAVDDTSQRLAKETKGILSQTSSVVRKAIAELIAELQELDRVIIAHERLSHQTVDDHISVSTEAARSVLQVRSSFERWKKKVEKDLR
jgi:hypothetical protein